MSAFMAPTIHRMSFSSPNKAVGKFRYTFETKHPHNQKLAGFKSGDHESHSNFIENFQQERLDFMCNVNLVKKACCFRRIIHYFLCRCFIDSLICIKRLGMTCECLLSVSCLKNNFIFRNVKIHRTPEEKKSFGEQVGNTGVNLEPLAFSSRSFGISTLILVGVGRV